LKKINSTSKKRFKKELTELTELAENFVFRKINCNFTIRWFLFMGIIKKIKKAIWNKKMLKTAQNNSRKKKMCNWMNANTVVAVYFYSNEKQALVDNFLQDLERMYGNLHITAIKIIDKKVQKLSKMAFETYKKELKQTAALSFDVLLHLDMEEEPNALLFANASQAKFKIGISKVNWNANYDFIIKADSVKEFIEILKKHISNF
jgi:hypothetical protein